MLSPTAEVQAGKHRETSYLLLDVKDAPRFQLLYTTCVYGFEAVARLLHECHRNQSLQVSSRFRLWGADLFDGDNVHLDELLEEHIFLKRHLLGVLADIAAILESVLTALTRDKQDRTVPEVDGAQVATRRLRIVLGQSDIACALSDEGEDDDFFEDTSDWEMEALENLTGLVDCLFDSLFATSMASKLHCLARNLPIGMPQAAAQASTETKIDGKVEVLQTEARINTSCLSRLNGRFTISVH